MAADLGRGGGSPPEADAQLSLDDLDHRGLKDDSFATTSTA
jgi:hypothetical protein